MVVIHITGMQITKAQTGWCFQCYTDPKTLLAVRHTIILCTTKKEKDAVNIIVKLSSNDFRDVETWQDVKYGIFLSSKNRCRGNQFFDYKMATHLQPLNLHFCEEEGENRKGGNAFYSSMLICKIPSPQETSLEFLLALHWMCSSTKRALPGIQYITAKL